MAVIDQPVQIVPVFNEDHQPSDQAAKATDWHNMKLCAILAAAYL